jgi:hypothetical protein
MDAVLLEPYMYHTSRGRQRTSDDNVEETVIEQSVRRDGVSLSTILAVLGCVHRGDHNCDKVTVKSIS